MNRLHARWTVVLLGTLAFHAFLGAAEIKTLTLRPESTLSLNGDSTLHPFSSRATQLNAQSELDSHLATASESETFKAVLQAGGLKHFKFTVPVTGLKSKESSLDKNMYKALKADQYPDITFTLSHYDVTVSTGTAPAWHLKALGMLQIAGKEQPITLEAGISEEASVLRVQGEYRLQMTSYGIKPPTMMMGAIKVKDNITIQFNLELTTASLK